MAEGGASTGGGGAGAAVVKEGKLFKRGEVMISRFPCCVLLALSWNK